MAIVHIRINGRDYDIACDDGQEEQLRLLADEVDDRVRSLVFSMGSNPGEGMALVLAALMMSDELAENKKEMERLSNALHGREAGNGAPAHDPVQDERMMEIEAAMVETLEEIAIRIEKIAEQIEIG